MNLQLRDHHNFAELALEARLAEREATFKEMSYACELEAMCAGKSRSALERIAAEIGLTPAGTRAVLDKWECRARLLDAAARLLRGLAAGELELVPGAENQAGCTAVALNLPGLRSLGSAV